MASSLSNSHLLSSRNFDLIKDSMLQSDELPLVEVLDGNQWQESFVAHEIDFGNDEDAIYTPAITLWALISQVFFKGEMRSCKAAVGRAVTLPRPPLRVGARLHLVLVLSWEIHLVY